MVLRIDGASYFRLLSTNRTCDTYSACHPSLTWEQEWTQSGLRTGSSEPNAPSPCTHPFHFHQDILVHRRAAFFHLLVDKINDEIMSGRLKLKPMVKRYFYPEFYSASFHRSNCSSLLFPLPATCFLSRGTIIIMRWKRMFERHALLTSVRKRTRARNSSKISRTSVN